MTDQKTQPEKFRHRHFPHFIKWGKAAAWKLSHLYFVMFIHFMTDKYEGKRHHLVVDSIYGVITFGLVAVNLGIGVWFLQHTEMPQFDVHVITASQVTSGREMDIATVYSSRNRDLENVQVSLYTPKEFIAEGRAHVSPLVTQLGAISAGTADVFDHTGVVFGNTGDIHSVSVIARFEYQGETYYEVAHRKIEVNETSFDAAISFPKNIAAGFSTTGTIRYENASDIAREDVEFTVTLPSNFTLEGITHKKRNLDFDTKNSRIVLKKIGARKKGKIKITGYFTPSKEQAGIVGGDQESEIRLSVRSRVGGGLIDTNTFYVSVPSAFETVRVIEPRVTASVTGAGIARFGESIVYTATVTNSGDDDAENVQLFGTASGSGLALYGGSVAFPVIEKLKQGKTKSVSVVVPTVVSGDVNPIGRLTVTGTAYSPLVDFDIPIEAGMWETMFTSQVALSASSAYAGPGGEQLGYGPYPPQATEPTALLVFVRLDNTNNVLSGATIQTTLPSQVAWTGETSVAAGSPLIWDEATRTVTWNIGSVPPQNGVQGAQFEVLFLPNADQIGLSPHLTNGWSMTGLDSFTGQGVSSFAGPIVTAPVVAPPKEEDGKPVDEIIIEENPLKDIVIE